MAELKRFNTKHEIHIKLCLTLAKHGFKFLGTWDLGEVEGFCQECGHPIRYEQNFRDVQTGDEYTIGSKCMFKIYILSHWEKQIKEKDLENKHLQRAGKWLWIIHRDGYLERISEEIPQPKDYNEDFKQLADDLKSLVFKVRVGIKKEKEEKRRQNKLDNYINYHAQSVQNWFVSQGIDINKCDDWEKDFLNSIYYKLYVKNWSLSEKQNSILNRIKKKKSIKQDIVTNQNLGSVAIVNEVSKYINDPQLSDWENEFMESTQQLVDAGHVLSQKQIEVLDKIDKKYSNDKETEDYSDFIGMNVTCWLINKLTGNWTEGVVKSVKNETKSAILCDVSVEDSLEKILEDVWIPKSQLIEDIVF